MQSNYPPNAFILLVLELLRKDLLPNIHPFLLLDCERLSWILERSRHDISEPSTQCLDNKHCLPI